MIIEYLLFIGLGLYLIAAGIFFYLFLRTLRTQDGQGLIFLRILTFSLSVGAFTIFVVRILSEYYTLDFLTARALAVTNPILLVAVGFYLNYLFHNPPHILTKDSQNIVEIKKDVKEVKKDTKVIRKEVKGGDSNE